MAITPADTVKYIKEITLPTGTTYTIVDYEARQTIDSVSTTVSSISSNLNSLSGTVDSVSSNLNSLSGTINDMSKYTQFLGVTTTNLTDGTTNAVVSIGGSNVTATVGSIVIKGSQEFIFTGTGNNQGWKLFGDLSALTTNLGDLAYKSSASSTTKYLTGITLANTDTTAISLTGSFTPSGGITLTKTAVTLALTTTSTTPANTANYWVYNPLDNISITASAPGTNTGLFLTDVTGRTALTSISTTAPVNTTPAGGINYTAVSEHNLKLQYLIHTTANTISSSVSAAAVTKVNAPTLNKSGTTRYIAPLSVTVTTAASFDGTAATITASGVQKIASVSTSTSSTVTVS